MVIKVNVNIKMQHAGGQAESVMSHRSPIMCVFEQQLITRVCCASIVARRNVIFLGTYL